MDAEADRIETLEAALRSLLEMYRDECEKTARLERQILKMQRAIVEAAKS